MITLAIKILDKMEKLYYARTKKKAFINKSSKSLLKNLGFSPKGNMREKEGKILNILHIFMCIGLINIFTTLQIRNVFIFYQRENNFSMVKLLA